MLIHGLSLCGDKWYVPSELEYEEDEDNQDFAVAVTEQGLLFEKYEIELVPYRKKLGEIIKVEVVKIQDYLQFDFQNFRIRMYPVGNAMAYSGTLLHPDFKFFLKKIEFRPGIINDLIFEETSYLIIGCNPDGYQEKEKTD